MRLAAEAEHNEAEHQLIPNEQSRGHERAEGYEREAEDLAGDARQVAKAKAAVEKRLRDIEERMRKSPV